MTGAEEARARILKAALKHVPDRGWSEPALLAGGAEAGFDALAVRRAFPGSGGELLDAFFAETDRRMETALARRRLNDMRVRDRVATAVRVWLEACLPHRKALRRAVAVGALPANAPAALRRLYRTVDSMWRAAGDTATDFSFYTKRALLAAVYGATLLYWLDDRSEGCAETWAFLGRRIEDVMRLGRTGSRLTSMVPGLEQTVAALFARLPRPR